MNHFFHDHMAFPSHLLCFLPCFVIVLGKKGREGERKREREREEGRKQREREKRGEMMVMVMVMMIVVAAFIEALSCAKYRDENFTNITSFSHQKACERLINPHFLIGKLSL